MRNILEESVAINVETPTRAWVWLVVIVTISALLRVVFFVGFFGTDEVTYLSKAIGIANGDWRVSDYIGALRYGIQVPMAFSIWLLGVSESAAASWAFASSVAEVALVYIFALRCWGMRVAVVASLILTTLPLHVSYAGRLVGDAPLAFFISLSFVLVWYAINHSNRLFFFAAGLSIGMVFWIKEVVIIYSLSFLVLPFLFQVQVRNLVWMAAGGLSFLIAHLVFMYTMTGNPLYVFENVANTVSNNYVGSGNQDTSVWFYFKYMFADGRHTGLMPLIALAGILVWLRNIFSKHLARCASFAVYWGLSLLAIFSFFVISLSPLEFIAKQTNYMLIFMAPLTLLAGYGISRLQGSMFFLILGSTLIIGVLLSALEQQAVHVFTSNSKATLTYVRENPDQVVYGSENAIRAATYFNFFDREANAVHIKPMGSLSSLDLDSIESSTGIVAYAIWDRETEDWSESPLRKAEDVPECWDRIGQLEPEGFGVGRVFVEAMLNLPRLMPERIGGPVMNKLTELGQPRPAWIYAIPRDCEFQLKAK